MLTPARFRSYPLVRSRSSRDCVILPVDCPRSNRLRAGAAGYVPKRAAPDELVSAIRAVSQGQVFLYPSLAGRLVQDYFQRVDTDEEEELADDLTPREREVLVLVAEGLTNPEIAEQLVISAKTVDRHRENIMRKLNAGSRSEAVAIAVASNLVRV